MTLASDRPIDDPRLDAFGRTRLAQNIAAVIRQLDAKESWGISIEGSWGSGKTSFMRLIERELAVQVYPTYTSTIWFNPWQFRTPAGLVRAFFRSLETRLGRWPRLFPFSAESALGLLGKAIAAAQSSTPAGALDLVASTLSAVGGRRRDIDSLRLESEKTLSWYARQPQPVKWIVFIDDLDRCGVDEINATLGLIRLFADLPSIVYVAGFDPEIVQGLPLLPTSARPASSYLDKIFSFRFPLPPMQRRHTLAALVGDLLRTSDHWASAMEQDPVKATKAVDIASKHATTPREIRRVCNQFRIICTSNPDGRTLFGPDALLVALLLCRDPSNGRMLWAAKDELVEPSETDAYVAKYIERKNSGNKESLPPVTLKGVDEATRREILTFLFPFAGNVSLSAIDTWEQQALRRIADAGSFDRYFMLQDQDSFLSRQDRDAIRDALLSPSGPYLLLERVHEILQRTHDASEAERGIADVIDESASSVSVSLARPLAAKLLDLRPLMPDPSISGLDVLVTSLSVRSKHSPIIEGVAVDIATLAMNTLKEEPVAVALAATWFYPLSPFRTLAKKSEQFMASSRAVVLVYMEDPERFSRMSPRDATKLFWNVRQVCNALGEADSLRRSLSHWAAGSDHAVLFAAYTAVSWGTGPIIHESSAKDVASSLNDFGLTPAVVARRLQPMIGQLSDEKFPDFVRSFVSFCENASSASS